MQPLPPSADEVGVQHPLAILRILHQQPTTTLPTHHRALQEVVMHPLPLATAMGAQHSLHRLALDLPDTKSVEPDDAILAVSITGQDAPMRTVFYQDHSHLTPGLHTRMTTYRTIVMVEVARDDIATTVQDAR